MFWTDGSGNGTHPEPFTLIKPEDIEEGTWVPVQEEHKVSRLRPLSYPRADFSCRANGTNVHVQIACLTNRGKVHALEAVVPPGVPVEQAVVQSMRNVLY